MRSIYQMSPACVLMIERMTSKQNDRGGASLTPQVHGTYNNIFQLQLQRCSVTPSGMDKSAPVQ
jgi:hypothetical protein